MKQLIKQLNVEKLIHYLKLDSLGGLVINYYELCTEIVS